MALGCVQPSSETLWCYHMMYHGALWPSNTSWCRAYCVVGSWLIAAVCWESCRARWSRFIPTTQGLPSCSKGAPILQPRQSCKTWLKPLRGPYTASVHSFDHGPVSPDSAQWQIRLTATPPCSNGLAGSRAHLFYQLFVCLPLFPSPVYTWHQGRLDQSTNV